jgi:hypothetical protein
MFRYLFVLFKFLEVLSIIRYLESGTIKGFDGVVPLVRATASAVHIMARL